MIDFKDGDIFRWRYNEKTLKTPHMINSANCGTLYWCCSNIGIWKDQRLTDTYWSTGGNRNFTAQEIGDKLVLTFIANINDLEPCPLYAFDKYNDEDCVNISHGNMTRGGFYIRKGAKESIRKQIQVLEHEIADHNHKASFHKGQAEHLRERLAEKVGIEKESGDEMGV